MASRQFGLRPSPPLDKLAAEGGSERLASTKNDLGICRQYQRVRSLGALGLVAVGLSCRSSPPPPEPPSFRELVEAFSEPGGYFDTDNLISNETAYVQVVDGLEPMGGAYVGVGPAQNFHYVGRVRPIWAFILDVRHENMLHHLLLNAFLERADTPYEFLCWQFARDCGPEKPTWTFDAMVGQFEAAPVDEEVFERNLAVVMRHIEGTRDMTLSTSDRRFVEFVYRTFFDEQLEIRFRSHGRSPMSRHPTYRRLLFARGPRGEPSHFLSRPEDYTYVSELARNGRLVPVVGDFSGDFALREIGRFLEERGLTVSALYVSNVEFYLVRSGRFGEYVENLRARPLDSSSQVIRAYFSYGYPHPAALPGHRSTLIRQKLLSFLRLYDRGAYQSYWDVSTLDYIH